ncbi:MAG TPA: META domain-containing protein [Anaerolineae bacterium]|nr:META domain-containing protein [Anaerolineae bacterium]
MKKTVVFFTLLLLLLAACGDGRKPEPTPQPEPTAVPEQTTDPNLTFVNWQWESLEQNGATTEVQAQKGQYLLFFKEDGSFSVGLDCNNGAGEYTATGDGSIAMQLGPMTLADCGPDSLADELMGLFGQPVQYVFAENNAVVTFTAPDGRIYTFRDIATIPQATVESPVESMEHVPNPDLINKLWVWERRDPNGNDVEEIIVPNPTDYTLFFSEDGSYFAKMDCRAMQGAYATVHSSIMLEPGPSTTIYCGDESLDTIMEASLAAAARYEIQENGNVLELASAAGGPLYYYRRVTAAGD